MFWRCAYYAAQVNAICGIDRFMKRNAMCYKSSVAQCRTDSFVTVLQRIRRVSLLYALLARCIKLLLVRSCARRWLGTRPTVPIISQLDAVFWFGHVKLMSLVHCYTSASSVRGLTNKKDLIDCHQHVLDWWIALVNADQINFLWSKINDYIEESCDWLDSNLYDLLRLSPCSD